MEKPEAAVRVGYEAVSLKQFFEDERQHHAYGLQDGHAQGCQGHVADENRGPPSSLEGLSVVGAARASQAGRDGRQVLAPVEEVVPAVLDEGALVDLEEDLPGPQAMARPRDGRVDFATGQLREAAAEEDGPWQPRGPARDRAAAVPLS